IGKLASQLQISLSSFRKRKATAGNLRDFRSWPYLIWGFVTAPFVIGEKNMNLCLQTHGNATIIIGNQTIRPNR
ncbi:hypothetical protein, partial [Lacticaseibacillus nasuensis]|uniref:hypothetical protein n=1 Tax=Lacticaseibacillus nasuensis TaxID=944671 RepID=UPI002245D2FA